MAGSLNCAMLIGRLGADPEVRRLNNGSAVANLRVATSETWRDKETGERKEKTEWHSVVVWSEGLVKIVEQYVKKGMLVHVIGKLQTRKWEKDGQERYTTEIVLQGYDAQLDFWQTEKREGGEGGGQRSGGGSSGGAARRDDMNDEIPF